MEKLHGSCHCKAVKYSLELKNLPEDNILKITDCNCSICSKTGHLHLTLPQNQVSIEGEDNLSLYQFGTKTAKHYFCRHCGVKPFYIPRSHPDCYSVNYRTVDNFNELKHEIIIYDGDNWSSETTDSIYVY